MTFQLQPEVPVFVAILLVTASLLLYALRGYHRRGQTPELQAFIVLLFVICVWQLTAIFISVITVPELIFVGNNIGNVLLVPGLAYSLAWFSLTYSGHTAWVNRWTAGVALATIGGVAVAVVLNPSLMLVSNGLTTQGPVTIAGVTFTEWVALDLTLQPAFRLYQLYIYLVMLGSGVIVVRYLLKNRGEIYRGQAVALAVGIGAVPGVNSLLFVGILPPEWNLTHVSFGVTAVAFAVAIFRYRLLEVAPVGRQQLVEQLADPVVMLDDHHRVVDCNPAARELVGAPENWRGMAATAFFAPFPDPVGWFTTAGSGETTLSEAGTERNFTIDSVPIENRTSTQTGQLIRLHEITEQKARERQLREQNEHLDEFASIVSHDLRSPLNVAQGRLKIAGWECDSEEITEAEKALTRMESMIDDLLTMARTSQTIDETEPVGLASAARTAWTYSDVDDCTLQVSFPESIKIHADRDRLLQVFENLYGNAAEHNETPVTVRVGVLGNERLTTDDGQRSGFYVSDDGTGIAADDREEVFESGYTAASGGTGFGLAIVQDIVTAHGWEIAVCDSSDGGARFEITGVRPVADDET
ncbi:sensor histidine kinase [Halonotius roseus]|uniref:histidine kinase n=1 Tax=Halonotius roseus TaxID=2511997 RepID=A0A544QKL3_9EURY|nr:histidine kinase N-terminal 7TM domain-containing protein [Halonotius roseus]TQQ78912.1 PAS domain-containing protein [Halonotius roseus]